MDDSDGEAAEAGCCATPPAPKPAAGMAEVTPPPVQQAPPAVASAPAAAADKPKRIITLLPSVFEGRPPVMLFSYTVACGAKQRPMERAVVTDPDAVPRLFYSHTDAVHEYNAVINILRQGGLYRVKADGNRWLLLWSNHPSPELLRALRPSQKTNHFPGSWNLGRKDVIWKNISRMQRKHGRTYQITPQGFVLPKGTISWEAARARSPGALWIWKPCSQSCGRGIKVISSSIQQDEGRELGRRRGVVQRYVDNPLLIDGYKFDLRIYVVVLSYDPLKVYINDEGLVRLATERYSSAPETLQSRTMHLTNYSVNKSSPAFVQNRDAAERGEEEGKPDEEMRASKWSLRELREHFDQKGLDYDLMFDRIKDVIIKGLIAVELPIREEWAKALEDDPSGGWAARGPAGAHRSTCFEMYGFDVLVDDQLRPWLLEVNICPSLSSGSPLDKRIKTKFVADTFTLVGLRVPPSMWRQTDGDRPADAAEDVNLNDGEHGEGHFLPSGPDLQQRAAKIAECQSSLEALAHFDEAAWELVLDSYDEDMRCGGLERVFPSPTSAKYTRFFEGGESYCNVVLRRWHEAGGPELLRRGGANSILPPWVPRQVCFTKT